MASSNLTLTYFDIRGLAEVARLVLAAGNKDYKDVRVKMEEWNDWKPKTPIGQMPYLEIDGEVFPESIPIWCFLAKEFGLYPSSNKDQLVVDVVNAVYSDVVKAASTWYYTDDPEEKEKKKTTALENTVKYLEYLENLLKKNGTGYAVGSSLTLADIVIFDLITGYPHRTLNYSPEKYPHIAKNNEIVAKAESLAPYLASRPDSNV